MKAYIVRLGEGHAHPRELVGFFCAVDQFQLYRLIDECCDPEGCEILELEPGGLFWNKDVDFVVPYPAEMPEEDAPGLPDGMAVTGNWQPALYHENDGKWERMIYDTRSAANNP